MAEEVHIEGTFFTEKGSATVPSTPFSLPLSATRNDLTQLINQLAKASADEESYTAIEYDFLVNGSLLRKTLGELVDSLELNKESVVRIECIQRNAPPSLDNEFPHDDWVSAVHCSEEYIVTGSYDSNVRIWTMEGDCIGEGSGHEREVLGVAWLSHDNQMLVSTSHDQHAHIWKFDEDTHELNCVAICKGHSRIIEALDVNDNRERFCTGGVDKVLKVWSSSIEGEELDETSDSKKPRMMEDKKPQSKVPLATLAGHTHPIMCIKWAGSNIYSGGYDHCIREWDTETGTNINTMTGSKVFLSIDKSCDSHVIATGHTDRHIRLWDTRTANDSLVSALLSSHSGWVKRVCWSPINEHQLVSGSYDNTAKLWDTRSPKVPLYTIAAHEGKLLCLDWSIPEVIASGGSDNMLRTFTF